MNEFLISRPTKNCNCQIDENALRNAGSRCVDTNTTINVQDRDERRLWSSIFYVCSGMCDLMIMESSLLWELFFTYYHKKEDSWVIECFPQQQNFITNLILRTKVDVRIITNIKRGRSLLHFSRRFFSNFPSGLDLFHIKINIKVKSGPKREGFYPSVGLLSVSTRSSFF